jgi:DNA-binding transcriptional ArsR family regulator
VIDVAVIEDPAAAEAALDPARARLLAQLAEPRSATMLATAAGLPRQKVNYHLRTLERHGLVELVEERRKGNVTERLVRATAASYVISPAALAAVAPDPARAPDRLSAGWLLALAAQLTWATSSPGRPGRGGGWLRSPWTARCGSPPPPTGLPSPRSSPAR